MRWGTPFWLDSVVKARLHEFAILFDSIWRSGRAVEGGKRYRWPPTPRRGGGWIRLIFSEAANHRESALVVVHDVRNPNFPFLMPVTASKGVTRRFYDISMP